MQAVSLSALFTCAQTVPTQVTRRQHRGVSGASRGFVLFVSTTSAARSESGWLSIIFHPHSQSLLRLLPSPLLNGLRTSAWQEVLTNAIELNGHHPCFLSVGRHSSATCTSPTHRNKRLLIMHLPTQQYVFIEPLGFDSQMQPNHFLQRSACTRPSPSRSGCHPCVLRARSLSSGRCRAAAPEYE